MQTFTRHTAAAEYRTVHHTYCITAIGQLQENIALLLLLLLHNFKRYNIMGISRPTAGIGNIFTHANGSRYLLICPSEIERVRP